MHIEYNNLNGYAEVMQPALSAVKRWLQPRNLYADISFMFIVSDHGWSGSIRAPPAEPWLYHQKMEQLEL